MPEQVLRFPGVRNSKISKQSALRGGKVASPTHLPPLPPQEILLVLISVTGWVKPRAIVRPEGLCQWKFKQHYRESNPLPSGRASTNYATVCPTPHILGIICNGYTVCLLWGMCGIVVCCWDYLASVVWTVLLYSTYSTVDWARVGYCLRVVWPCVFLMK
jgi:hypothetical protein